MVLEPPPASDALCEPGLTSHLSVRLIRKGQESHRARGAGLVVTGRPQGTGVPGQEGGSDQEEGIFQRPPALVTGTISHSAAGLLKS
jgi:hypothetical protein